LDSRRSGVSRRSGRIRTSVTAWKYFDPEVYDAVAAAASRRNVDSS